LTSLFHDYLYIAEVLRFPKLLFPYVPAEFSQIDVAVGVDLNVAAVGGQEQVEDVVTIELRHSAPAAASYGATLQFLVVVRIDPVDKSFDSYLISHLFVLFIFFIGQILVILHLIHVAIEELGATEIFPSWHEERILHSIEVTVIFHHFQQHVHTS